MRRKSVRVFEDREIAEADRRRILEASLRAATAGNMTLYTIIDVKEQKLKDRLAVTCDNQPFIATAPLVLVYCADYRRWYQAFCQVKEVVRKPSYGDFLLAAEDTIIAAQTAVTAADALGLGKTADAVEACSYSYLYEIDIRTLNLCFPIRIFRPQLSVALMRLDKGEKFVVEPEGINEYGIYLANPFLGCPAVERSAAADNLLCTDTVNKVGFGLHRVGDLRIGKSHTVGFVRVASAYAWFMVFVGKTAGCCIGFFILTRVENLHKVKLFHNFRVTPVGSCVAEAHIFFPAGMGRTEHTAIGMDDGNQDIKRQAAQLQNAQLDRLRDDNQNMPGADGVIFDSFKNFKVRIFFILQIFLPETVAVVGVVVCDDHAAEAFRLKKLYIFLHGNPAVNRAFLYMAMHVDFHNRHTSFNIIIVAFFVGFEKGKTDFY